MNPIKVIIPSRYPHNNQIIVGFLLLKKRGYNINIDIQYNDKKNLFYKYPVILVEYKDKRIVYDLWDGYQDVLGMKVCLDWADIYFKRSYSEKLNEYLFNEANTKMYPLGFNYDVTCYGNPLNEPIIKSIAKIIIGREPVRYFTPSKFKVSAKKSENPKIMFLTRLWNDRESDLDEKTNAERTKINSTRIEIIRILKDKYGDSFIGGLSDNEFTRKTAPDLIAPNKMTKRKEYLKLMHSCDICIATTGLHNSIGWKTGEYVAASKAIVSEKFHYDVPGNFEEGANFLSFSTAEECVKSIEFLISNLSVLENMKNSNEEYYENYLRPDKLVENTLKIIDNITNNIQK